MTAVTIHAFDQRQPVIVNPSEIRAGDWMRDLGRLRKVETVETTNDQTMPGTLVRFTDTVDGQYGTLNICKGVKAIVWRTLPQSGQTAALEASSHAQA